jgi:hypothetical protein
LEKSNLAYCSWYTGQNKHDPVHNVPWRLATLYATQGEYERSLQHFYISLRLEPLKEKKLVLSVILLAAQSEVAVLLWERQSEAALKLLTSKAPEEPGIQKLMSLIRSQPG